MLGASKGLVCIKGIESIEGIKISKVSEAMKGIESIKGIRISKVSGVSKVWNGMVDIG